MINIYNEKLVFANSLKCCPMANEEVAPGEGALIT
jgi:hypothetical protein